MAVTFQSLDTSQFLTSSSLENYVTNDELTEKGYVTSSALNNYVTDEELNSKGYLTSVPSEYVTETELDAKGYLTSVPSGYVTSDQLSQELSQKMANCIGILSITTIPSTGLIQIDLTSILTDLGGGTGGTVIPFAYSCDFNDSLDTDWHMLPYIPETIQVNTTAVVSVFKSDRSSTSLTVKVANPTQMTAVYIAFINENALIQLTQPVG